MKKRILSIVLALALSLSLLPAAALAAGSTTTPQEGDDLTEKAADASDGANIDLDGKKEGGESFVNPFADVSEDKYYYDAVLWAADSGITKGSSATAFSPDASCTRAEMATFLWRAAGSPEPAGSTIPFADVSPDAYYAKAVQWAVEQGITKGTSETAFSPDEPCSRAQMAVFIYRNERANGGGFTGTWMFRLPFRDAPGWAYEAIAWCYKEGITKGTGDGTTFSPDDPCTRAEMVTFLYGYFGKEKSAAG